MDIILFAFFLEIYFWLLLCRKHAAICEGLPHKMGLLVSLWNERKARYKGGKQ